jgi:hypothetical protein
MAGTPAFTPTIGITIWLTSRRNGTRFESAPTTVVAATTKVTATPTPARKRVGVGVVRP